MTNPAHDCCSATQTKTLHPKKISCPVSGGECDEVSLMTVIQHIKFPWNLDRKDRRFFFCKDQDCDVVYVGDDNSVIRQSGVRTNIGLKNNSDEATLCYCFGVTRADALNDPSIKAFVVAQTKQKFCSCKTRNPSGQCCLKNFPR